MYNYIDKNFNLFNIKINDSKFYLYKNEQLVLQGIMKPLKELGLPVRPFEYKECYILLDYYKGVKIYKNKSEYFFKFTSVYGIGTINNYIIFFGQKKIYIINIETLEIIKEMNRSENLDFSQNNNYALFYRLKNNKSYLIDCINNKTIYLNNFMRNDVIIHKIYVTNDDLYVLISNDFFKKVIKYNLRNFKTEIVDMLGKGSNNAAHYFKCFQMVVNDEYSIEDLESLNYIEFLCYMYKKYGLFVTLYSIDNKKLAECKDTKYNIIVSTFQKLIKILNISENSIDSNERLECLKNEIVNSQKIIENEVNMIIQF